MEKLSREDGQAMLILELKKTILKLRREVLDKEALLLEHEIEVTHGIIDQDYKLDGRTVNLDTFEIVEKPIPMKAA